MAVDRLQIHLGQHKFRDIAEAAAYEAGYSALQSNVSDAFDKAASAYMGMWRAISPKDNDYCARIKRASQTFGESLGQNGDTMTPEDFILLRYMTGAYSLHEVVSSANTIAKRQSPNFTAEQFYPRNYIISGFTAGDSFKDENTRATLEKALENPLYI